MRACLTASIGAALVVSTVSAICGETGATSTGATIAVIKARNECFFSIVRGAGYVVPRRMAFVMFNAPGFRIAEISAKPGDLIKVGDQMAVAVPISLASADAGTAPQGATGKPAAVSIRSLAGGTVLRANAEVGMLTSVASAPLFVLAVNGEMEASADVSSVHMLELRAGQTAHVFSDDGQEFNGHVRAVPIEINKVTQFGEARISIDGEKALTKGRFVRVTIDASRSCGIGVPLAALTRDADGIRVQIVRNDTIQTRVVRLGLLNDADAEIKDGIVNGDLVVSDAGTSLRDGDKVRPSLVELQEPR